MSIYTEQAEAWKARAEQALADLALAREAKEQAEDRIQTLESALRAAMLHLMVRPHMRMPDAEEAVKGFARAALAPTETAKESK